MTVAVATSYVSALRRQYDLFPPCGLLADILIDKIKMFVKTLELTSKLFFATQIWMTWVRPFVKTA